MGERAMATTAMIYAETWAKSKHCVCLYLRPQNIRVGDVVRTESGRIHGVFLEVVGKEKTRGRVTGTPGYDIILASAYNGETPVTEKFFAFSDERVYVWRLTAHGKSN
jgi:hypothetical protein